MLKGPITMTKANMTKTKCVEWSLSGQNRLVNMEYRALQAISTVGFLGRESKASLRGPGGRVVGGDGLSSYDLQVAG